MHSLFVGDGGWGVQFNQKHRRVEARCFFLGGGEWRGVGLFRTGSVLCVTFAACYRWLLLSRVLGYTYIARCSSRKRRGHYGAIDVRLGTVDLCNIQGIFFCVRSMTCFSYAYEFGLLFFLCFS